MNLSAPICLGATTAMGAGFGLALNYYAPTVLVEPSTFALVGAGFGAVMGGLGMLTAAVTNPDRPVKLATLYKALMKDQYRFVKKFTGGKSGCHVVLATQRSDNKMVVLKMPRPNSDVVNIRYRSEHISFEYHVAIRINSPYVMKGLAYFTNNDDRENYFVAVYEYVPGLTLQDHLEQKGPLTLVEAKEIFTALAKGLRDMDQAGYVHGDTGPGNVVLHPERKGVWIDLQYAMEQSGQIQVQLEYWAALLRKAVTYGQTSRMGDAQLTGGMTVQEIIHLRLSQIRDSEFQKIVDRIFKKNGAAPYPNFDSLIADLEQWRPS